MDTLTVIPVHSRLETLHTPMQFWWFQTTRFKLDEGRDSVKEDRREEQRSGIQSRDQHGARTAALRKPEPPSALSSSTRGWTELADSTGPVASMFIQHPHVVVASRRLSPASSAAHSRGLPCRMLASQMTAAPTFLPGTRYQGGSSVGEIYVEQAVHQTRRTRQGHFLRPCCPQITHRCRDK